MIASLNYLAQIKTPGQAAQTGSATSSVIGTKIGEIISWFFSILPLALVALGVVFLTFFLAKILKNMVVKSLSNHNTDDQVLLLVGKTTYVGTVVLGFTIALEVVGIDISPVVGLIGLGFGFAMQDIIKNFVCGALILVQEPFRIGDVVQVGDYIGKVENIEARSTSIKTFDGQRVIIPNADMFSSSVTNFSAHPERRLEIIVGVHYSTDLNKASRVIMSQMTEMSEILTKPAPKILFSDFADSAINISVKFWVDKDSNVFGIRSELIGKIKESFEIENINIPYPIRTLDIPEQKQKTVPAISKKENQVVDEAKTANSTEDQYKKQFTDEVEILDSGKQLENLVAERSNQ